MLHSRLIALPLVFFVNATSAFEINTHAFMSQKAYEPSVLSPSHPNSILPIIGLDRWPKIGTFDINQGLPALRGIRRYFDDVDVNEPYLTATARPTTVMPFLEPLATQQTLLTFSFEANSPSTPFAQAMGRYLALRKFACGCATAPIRLPAQILIRRCHKRWMPEIRSRLCAIAKSARRSLILNFSTNEGGGFSSCLANSRSDKPELLLKLRNLP